MAKFNIENLKEIPRILKELAIGLRGLTFADNFQSFETTLTWAVSDAAEIKVRNQLTVIPSRYIIVSQTGDANVTKGDTTWDSDYIYFKNNDTTVAVKVKIIVLR